MTNSPDQATEIARLRAELAKVEGEKVEAYAQTDRWQNRFQDQEDRAEAAEARALAAEAQIAALEADKARLARECEDHKNELGMWQRRAALAEAEVARLNEQ